jgi:hypothetical protein
MVDAYLRLIPGSRERFAAGAIAIVPHPRVVCRRRRGHCCAPLLFAQRLPERHGLAPAYHLQLGAHGVRKRFPADFDWQQAEDIITLVCGMIDEHWPT